MVACVVTPDGQRIRTFGTTTRELRALAEWLAGQGVTHVAMESTGVYWNRHEGGAHTAQDESRVC